MPAIEAVVIVITRYSASIQVLGGDEEAKETYEIATSGELEIAEGNFEEEPLVNENGNLLEALARIVEPIEQVYKAMREG